MRTIITKLIRAGRATLFGVGLAVILTLTAGGVTTALAAQPGDPFLLGKFNALSAATTILRGEQTNGAMLDITNVSSDFDDPALMLRVQAGRPPLEVSAGAGKAPNLDADKLDGQDATAFATGTNGKANDADKLDGKDSTAFANGTNGKANDADKLDGLDSTAFANGTNGTANNADKLDGKDSTAFANGTGGKANDADKLDGQDSTAFWMGKSYQVSSENFRGPGGGNPATLRASCDVGDTLLHVGGGNLTDKEDTLLIIRALDNRTGDVVWLDNGSGGLFFATVLCADFPPLRP